MIRKKIFLALLCCMLLWSMSVLAVAAEQRIGVGETVTVVTDRSGESVVELYRFTPEAAGTYVLYLSSGSTEQVRIGVLDTTDGSGYLSRGSRRCVLEAQSGVTYWFEIECGYEEGAVERTFTLDAATAVESISLSAAECSGVVGEEFRMDVIYSPLNGVGAISWSAEPAGAVRMTGDDGSCKIRLEAAGTATVSAVSDNGSSAQCVVQIQEMPILRAGETAALQVSAGTGVDGSRTWGFVPEKDGTYQFSVEPAEQILLYVQGPSGGWDGDQEVRFQAKAGERYLLTAYYWGDHLHAVEHALTLQECPPMERFTLDPGADELRVGDTCDISLIPQPQLCLTEPVKWTVSDPTIARIEYGGNRDIRLKLHKAGTVTVTAVSDSGKTASVTLTVLEARTPVLLLADRQTLVDLKPGEIVQILFTPEESGYYLVQTDHRGARVWLDGEATLAGSEELFWLEAGENCGGQLHNLSEELLNVHISAEKRDVLTPVGLEISKAPSNTTFLRSMVHELHGYQLLAGLELCVTWSDGSQSQWCYDTDSMYLGTEYMDHRVVESADGSGVLELFCGDVSASCSLELLDLTTERVELVDSSPIRVVERSCGASDGGYWIYAANVYLNRQVQITFSDGSVVTAWPGEAVYGIEVEAYDNQDEHNWVRGRENIVEYVYGERSDFVDVQIVESGVDRIELVTPPKTEISYHDNRYFYDYGYDRYFAPTDLRDFLEGLSLKIFYSDGTSVTVGPEEIQWRTVMGQEYPYVDGYPLGYFGEAVNGQTSVDGTCEMKNHIEYMGASAAYTIRITDEDMPGMGDEAMLPAMVLALCLSAAMLPLLKKKK